MFYTSTLLSNCKLKERYIPLVSGVLTVRLIFKLPGILVSTSPASTNRWTKDFKALRRLWGVLKTSGKATSSSWIHFCSTFFIWNFSVSQLFLSILVIIVFNIFLMVFSSSKLVESTWVSTVIVLLSAIQKKMKNYNNYMLNRKLPILVELYTSLTIETLKYFNYTLEKQTLNVEFAKYKSSKTVILPINHW